MSNWVKVAAIGVGLIIAFLIVGSVVHFILGAITTILIAGLVVVGVAVAIKVARSRKQVSRKREEKQVREPDYSEYARPLPRADIEPITPQSGRQGAPDVDDELARLKREMGR